MSVKMLENFTEQFFCRALSIKIFAAANSYLKIKEKTYEVCEAKKLLGKTKIVARDHKNGIQSSFQSKK